MTLGTSCDAPPSWEGVRENLRRMPVENISTIAGAALGNPEVIALWFGEGDLPTPVFAANAVRAAIRAGQVFYAQQNGVPELRQALAQYLNGLHGTSLAANRITTTTGGMGALQLAISLIVEAGDNVLIIDPVWPNIGSATRVAGGVPRSVRMDLTQQGWQLDLGKVQAACDSRTKAVFFASPGNPTGAIIPIQTQKALLEFCRERGIWVIADEVYNRVVFGQRSAPSIAQIAHAEDRLLIINSFSKSWAMTGWRLGWLVHPPSLETLLANLTQYSCSGQPTFVQHAAVDIVRNGEEFVERMNRYCEQGMELVCDALQGMGRVRLTSRPRASMYVFFEVQGMEDSRAACRDILEKARVGLAPGAFFGPGSETFLRLCYCRSPDQLRLSMERLRPLFR